MTGDRRRPRPGLVIALVAIATVGAACGSASTSGPEAEVSVSVVDGDTATAATLATQTADDETTTGDDPTSPADGAAAGGDATDGGADEPPTVAEGSLDSPSASDNLGIALPLLTPLNESNEEEPILPPDVSAIAFGEINDGDIEAAFAADYWTFSATEGQILTVEVLSIGDDPTDCRQDLTLFLADSQANRWNLGWIGNNACEGHGPFLLPTTGDYELQFVGGDGGIIEPTTGPYRFIPRILTQRTTAPLQFGTLLDGEISEIFGSEVWTFDATAGQILTVEVTAIGETGCSQDLEMFVIDPLGQRNDAEWIGNNRCEAHGPYQLTETGTYALEFAGGDGGIIQPAIGIYQFQATLQ